ncbi:MAG: hypothetical protein AB1765_07170, partial [Candidatus Hydrogenedentota bacterium]
TLAGRSKDGKAVTIIIANFNPHLYFKEYPFSPPQDAPSREAPSQVREVMEEAKRGYNYTKYNLEMNNLPWKSARFERYLVDDSHKLELIETGKLSDYSLTRETKSPSVEIIRLYEK